MDARLATLSDELCQVTTRVNHIARRRARLGGFITSPSPSPEASEDEDVDDGTSDDDFSVTYPLSFMTKKGSSFGIRVVMYLEGELA